MKAFNRTSTKHNRLGRHIKEAISYLRELGVSDVDIGYGKHIKLSWVVDGRKCTVSCSGTPTDYDVVFNNIKLDINRRLRAIRNKDRITLNRP